MGMGAREMGGRGRKVGNKFRPPWSPACCLRDPASFESTRASFRTVAGFRKMQMLGLAKAGRPCNFWPRLPSFPSGQKNRATRRGTPGVKEG